MVSGRSSTDNLKILKINQATPVRKDQAVNPSARRGSIIAAAALDPLKN